MYLFLDFILRYDILLSLLLSFSSFLSLSVDLTLSNSLPSALLDFLPSAQSLSDFLAFRFSCSSPLLFSHSLSLQTLHLLASIYFFPAFPSQTLSLFRSLATLFYLLKHLSLCSPLIISLLCFIESLAYSLASAFVLSPFAFLYHPVPSSVSSNFISTLLSIPHKLHLLVPSVSFDAS